MGDIVTSTFHLDKDLYWELKRIVTQDQRTMKEAYTSMVQDSVNDWKDRHSEKAIEVLCKQEIKNPDKYQSWCDFKRRSGLDGLQKGSSGSRSAKRCSRSKYSGKGGAHGSP